MQCVGRMRLLTTEGAYKERLCVSVGVGHMEVFAMVIRHENHLCNWSDSYVCVCVCASPNGSEV